MRNPTPSQAALLTAAANTTDTHLLARQLGRSRKEIIEEFNELVRLGLCSRIGRQRYRVLLIKGALIGTATFHLQGDRITAAVHHSGGIQPTNLSAGTDFRSGADPAQVVRDLNALSAPALAYPTPGRGKRLTWQLSVLGGKQAVVNAILKNN